MAEMTRKITGITPHVIFLAAAHADHGGPDRPVLQVSADERRAFRSRSERRIRFVNPPFAMPRSVMCGALARPACSIPCVQMPHDTTVW
jgi:hypothetical protein